MKRLRLTPEAELDLDEAHAWYLEQRPGLGGQFLRAVDASIGAILRHPEAYQLVDRKMRRALLRRFPYAVFFEVGEAESLFLRSLSLCKGPAQLETQTRRITGRCSGPAAPAAERPDR